MEEEMVIKNGFRTPSFVTSPTNYSQSEIITMQQDAVKRVNEMRMQAMKHINPTDENSIDKVLIENSIDKALIENLIDETLIENQDFNINNENPQNFNPIKEILENSQINEDITQPMPNSLAGIFDKLDLDSEKIILIGLMLLLMNEGADNTLLMALGYILL